MRIGTWVLGGAAVIFAGAAAYGADNTAPTRDQLIAARQAALDMSAASVGGIKAALARGADVKTLAFPAAGVAKWAHALPGLFPAGSGGAPSHALPTVWSDRAGFEKAAANYAAAAGAMAAAAKAGDKDAFAAAFAQTGEACDACHKVYREPDNH
jgi:cytochrome c556